MNILKVVILCFCTIGIAVAQNQDTCITVQKTEEEMAELPWYGNNDTLPKLLEDANSLIISNDPGNQNSGPKNLPVCSIHQPLMIPVKFWFYQEIDNDPLMPNDLELQMVMDELNKAYQENDLLFRFYMLCPEFITDPELVDVNDWQSYWNLDWQASVNNAINIHVVKNLGGSSGTYYKIGNFIVVNRIIYNNIPNGTTTLIHEIGHFLGLEHPHRNWDKGKCRQECVSRTKKFQASLFCFKLGTICEKNGDGLCDTPAEPRLSGIVDANCFYLGTSTDNYNIPWEPATDNYMSYTRRDCRSRFTFYQRSVMTHYAVENQSFIDVDALHVDADEFEPDNSDFIGVPRQIEIGDVQCHSFNSITGCDDIVDWVRIQSSESTISKYTLTLIEQLGPNTVVGQINFWRTDAAGNRLGSEIFPIKTIDTEQIAFSFDCTLLNLENDILVEVKRKDGINEGEYLLDLKSDLILEFDNNDTALCQGDEYNIIGLPTNSNVLWASSENITINIIGGGSGVEIISFDDVSTEEFWISASIQTNNGCTEVLRKDFLIIDGTPVEEFSIIEVEEPCYTSNYSRGIYQISPYNNNLTYEWEAQNASIHFQDHFIYLIPNNTGEFSFTISASNECGDIEIITVDGYIEECKSDDDVEIVIYPNPSPDFTTISITDAVSPVNEYYRYLIFDQMNQIKRDIITQQKSININLSDFHNGVYSVIIQNDYINKQSSLIVSK